ncbi:hypothetical protein FD723_30475 [Nostoc sp. C052]|nr:hypothetical protein FD723_30475 [Nostoc sp. C052]
MQSSESRHKKLLSKYTRRLEIAATQTKSAYADSKNFKPTEVGFVCIAAFALGVPEASFHSPRLGVVLTCFNRC